MFKRPTKRARRLFFTDQPSAWEPIEKPKPTYIPMADPDQTNGVAQDQETRSVTLTGIPVDWTLRDIRDALERMVQQGNQRLFNDATRPGLTAGRKSQSRAADTAARIRAIGQAWT